MDTSSKQPTLLPAYLIVGEDLLKQRRVIERLRESASKLGDLEFNHDRFDGESASGADVAAACNTLPFMSDVRLVEVAQADKMRKEDSEALVDYLAHPSPSTVLALIADKLAKNTRLYKAVAGVGKTAVIDCAPMKSYELAKAVRSMAPGHGFTMTAAAADKLVEFVGADTVRIDSELRKLAFSHAGTSAPVTDRDIESMVARTSELAPWNFVDALARRDVAACVGMYPRLGKNPAYGLITLCATRMRELVLAKTIEQRGDSTPLERVLGGPSWRYKNHASDARRFTLAELEGALVSLRDAERAMKSGSDPDRTFMDWVIAVAARPADR